MAAPDPLLGTVEEFTEADWRECVAGFRPSGPNSFSQEGGEAALTGLVPAMKVRGALRFFLGYNFAPFAGAAVLRRTNPIYHPRYHNLLCTSAAEEEFAPPGTRKVGGGSFPRDDANDARDSNEAPLKVAPKISRRATYKQSRITLRFQPVNYTLLEDSQLEAAGLLEDSRNTCIDTEPRVEVLSLDGFTLRYAEGQANTAPVSNPFGNDFPAPIGQMLAKPDITLMWKHLPRRYLMRPGAGEDLPINIVTCLGKVNDRDFRGYTKGTLLLLGAKMEKKPWPLCLGQEDPWQYNVTFLFSFFDPPKGKTGDVQITTNRGHVNMPWKGSFAAGDTNSGRWFLATRTGGAGVASVDPRLFEEADFRVMFNQA